MNSKARGQWSGSQPSTNPGATRQRKNSKSTSTDKSKSSDETDDFPPHAKPTFVSHVMISAKSSQKNSAAAEEPRQKIDAILDPHHPGIYQSSKQVAKPPEESQYYKEEYRKIKSDYTKLSEKYEKVDRELATTKSTLKSKKGVTVAQLTDALTKKDSDLKFKEKMLEQIRGSHQALEQEYHRVCDRIPKLEAELREKSESVLQLTIDISKQDEELKLSKKRYENLEEQRKQYVNNLAKVKDEVAGKHADLYQRFKQAEEDLKTMTQSHLSEVSKREHAEQQLVDVKMELAKLKEKTDDYVIVNQPSKQAPKKIKEMEDTISTLTKRLDELGEELEKSKSNVQSSAIKHQQDIDQMIVIHQQQIQKLEDDMQSKAAEYQRSLEAKEDTERSMEWGRVKIEEKEWIIEHLHANYNAKMEEMKKENKSTKSKLQTEIQKQLELANEIKKLQEGNSKWEAIVSSLNTKLRKMESELKEIEDQSQTVKKENQEIQTKLTQAWQENDKLLHEKDELVKRLENSMKGSTKEPDQLIGEVKITGDDKQTVGKANQEMLEHENFAHQEKNDLKVEEIRRMEYTIKDQAVKLEELKIGNKEREDRIAELEEFINDQVTELDKMEAAMKQTVANKEIAEKELNEALDKKQEELTALQIAYDERDKEICQMKQSPIYDEAESSQVNSQLLDTEEKLTEANKQLLAYEEEIQKLNESLTKKENSSRDDIDPVALLETTKRLTEEVAVLKKQKELQEQKESKMQAKIIELTQQVEHLQEENEKLLSGTTNKSHNVSDKSLVEYQHQGHTNQPVQLQRKIDELESELESVKLMMENEKKKYEEKLNESKARSPHQQPINQVDMDHLLKENEGHKQAQNQLYESYEKLKSRYRLAEEKISDLKKQYNQLQSEFDNQRIDLNKARKELEGITTLVEKQHEKLVLSERDRDIAMGMIDKKEIDETAQIELSATIVALRSNHSLLIDSKDDEIAKLKESKEQLEKGLDSKEFEISQLTADKKDLEEKLALRLRRISATQPTKFDSAQDATLLQDCSRESTHPSSKAEASQDLLVTLRERDQTIKILSNQVEQLQKQLIKSSDDSGVGGPCVEHTQSGGVGDFPNEGNRNADSKSQLSELQSQVDALTKKLMVKQSAEKDQLDQLTRELALEKSATENAKSEMDKLMDQLQQLHRDNKILDQQMKAGCKEREDRIAELEEFINDQVTELDKMEAAMKQTVANKQLLENDYQKSLANKQLLEKEHQKLNEYYNTAKNLVEQYEQRHIAQEETISMARQTEENANKAIAILEQEKEGLIQQNQKLSREVARLMSVDVELDKCKIELRKAEEELQTKEFMLNTYKEDFEQERKDRENAHNIKEDEITKARVKMEEFEAECQEKIKNVQQSVEVKMNTLKQQVNQLAIERDKFKKENERLRADLDKEKKDAQTKFDVYKKKTEQFQLQWKKREEAEVKINTLTEQLNNQHELNKQLTSTIDTMMRRSKGIEPHIPSNNIASQLPSHQQRRISPHNPVFSNMSTQADISSDHQYHTPSTVSSSDTSLSHTNAGMGYHHQPPPSSTSQSSQQRPQEQQYHYKMQQQQQEEQLHPRGQGRGTMHNQPVRPQHEATHYPFDHPGQSKKFLPPANIDYKQPRSIQPGAEYNVTGTNAAPMKLPPDNYNYARSSGPASLDSSITTKPRPSAGHTNLPPVDQSPLTVARRPEKPTQYASEGINEEIRYQANKQRRYQEYESFDSNLQLDPYLICPKCKFQFREGQLPEYRHHIDNCHQ